MSKRSKEELTLEEVYKRLRECLGALKPSDEKLSRPMRQRLDYNLYFLRAFIELQSSKDTDVQAIGFDIESERDEEDESEGEEE